MRVEHHHAEVGLMTRHDPGLHPGGGMRTGRIESHRELSQGLRPRGGGEACQPWPVEGVEKVAAVPAGAGFDGGLHGGMSGVVAAMRRMAGLNSGLGGGLHRWATPEGARDE